MVYIMSLITHLTDRALLSISGPEAEHFLQGLITNDITKKNQKSGAGPAAIFSGLLTPQGKILFDFFVMPAETGYLLDIAVDMAADFMKRLRFYKLRADVEIEDMSETLRVIALSSVDGADISNIAYYDMRGGEGRLGLRAAVTPETLDMLQDSYEETELQTYHAQRIHHSIPEGGIDYPYGQMFPHDVCYDFLGGVDFHKGCYIGQEVVSRMYHRGTARKRVVKVSFTGPALDVGADIKVGDLSIGRMGSSVAQDGETDGVAIVRLDRAAQALSQNTPITCEGQILTLTVPDWADYIL